MIRTTLRITEEQRKRLAEMSKARGVSVSELVRQAIDEFIGRRRLEHRLDVLDQTFGAIPSLPDGEEYTRGVRDAWARRSAE